MADTPIYNGNRIIQAFQMHFMGVCGERIAVRQRVVYDPYLVILMKNELIFVCYLNVDGTGSQKQVQANKVLAMVGPQCFHAKSYVNLGSCRSKHPQKPARASTFHEHPGFIPSFRAKHQKQKGRLNCHQKNWYIHVHTSLKNNPATKYDDFMHYRHTFPVQWYLGEIHSTTKRAHRLVIHTGFSAKTSGGGPSMLLGKGKSKELLVAYP